MPPSEIVILQELLAAEEGFVSGTHLAERLQVSRVAVWSHMEKLRALGFEFEARPRRGYRILQFPEGIEPLYLQALMPERWQSTPLFFREEIDSTNSEAERQLAAGTGTPFVVLARAQTEGRGRLGRRWFSGDSGNLYISFAFQPRLSPARMQAFTLWMGASICDFLNRNTEVPVLVKWPNDLMLHGKKLGGMLTEARIDSDQIRDLVFGLGINVNGSPDVLPPELRGIATSLSAATGSPLDLNPFTASLLTTILDAYQAFVSGDVRTELLGLWQAYDYLKGREVTARQGTQEICGTAHGINPEGCLTLETPDGLRTFVTAGDVTLVTGATT
jgi:BirA family transcriptional regulator, biotin operon repressor / biotin---[acetyl-CoA-carboxylase] ligase